MRHCTDCKHYEAPQRCTRDVEFMESPVTGERMQRSKSYPDCRTAFCEVERFSASDTSCGMEARFYEPRLDNDNGR